jgi:PAS domain S-box-containing protein
MTDHHDPALPAGAEPTGTTTARYQALFQHARLGILLADAHGVYLDANPALCRMLGYTRDELVGRHSTEIVAPDEVSRVDAALEEIGAQRNHRRRWRLRCKDGSLLMADVTAVPLPDGTVLATLDYVSERQRADEHSLRLAAIVESAPDGIIGRGVDGVITSWNAGATRILGYSAAEMIGQPVARLIPPSVRAMEAEYMARLWQGEAVSELLTQRIARDGRLLDVLLTAAPVRDAAGQIIWGAAIIRDVTAARQQEHELARLSRLHAALSAVNQAIVWSRGRQEMFARICAALVEHGGFVMAWVGWHNAEACQLVPVAAHGDDEGYLHDIRIFTDDRPEARGSTGTAFRTGRPMVSNDILSDPAARPWHAQMQRRGYRATAAFPIRLEDRPCGTLTVYAGEIGYFQSKEVALLEEAATDISFALANFDRDAARRAAEEQLRNAKLFNDAMIESMPGIVYFYDRNGRFLRCNANFEAVSGYSGAEIAGMHPADFFAEADRPALQAAIAAVFDTGEATVEAPFLSRDGTATPYLFTGRRLEFEGATCLVGVGIDITARRDAEAERERRHRAEAADQIKSAFLATMSHELRTPLNAIIGFTGIVLQGLAGPLTAEQDKQLGMVRSSARHLLALINDVLDISKIEAGQLGIVREPFDVASAIGKVLALVGPQAAAKGLALHRQLAPGLGEMVGDARRFQQILLNLLSNAIKFTETGSVTLEAERDASGIRVRVTDTGIGIGPADLGRLFQPFIQIDSGLARQHDGTGLGLAICRRLAMLMGGTVTAQSTLGKGSCFTLTLPALAAGAAPAGEAPKGP